MEGGIQGHIRYGVGAVVGFTGIRAIYFHSVIEFVIANVAF
jgi:hypothetical protein